MQGAHTEIRPPRRPVEDVRDDAVTETIAELKWLREVIRQAPAGICVTIGPEHRIAAANAAYLEIIARDTIAGRTVREAFPELDQQGYVDILDEVYRTGEPYIGQERVVLVDRDGDGTPEPTFFNFTYQPLLDSGGEPFGVVTHAVEVTAQVLARQLAEEKAAELVRISKELQRSNEELDEFAHVASHDLKAPLRAIGNLSDWIEEDLRTQLTGRTREYMQLLRSRVQRLEALIDGILEYSRAGRMHCSPERVDVQVLISEVVELIGVPTDCAIEVGEGMPVLDTERLPLQQVFMNLIGNAVKHARSTAPHVWVTVGDKGAFHEFSVADNGPGIAPAFRDRIWGIFQTVEPRGTVEGTGIGLALVKKIVTAKGGGVWIESAEGTGADFRFLWPKRG